MKFTFENLGPIKHGEIEPANMTVICGKNNTGKTYLTYAIYGFLRNWRQYIDLQFRDLLKLSRGESVAINLQRYTDAPEAIINRATSRYLTQLSSIAGGSTQRFESTKLDITFGASDTRTQARSTREPSRFRLGVPTFR